MTLILAGDIGGTRTRLAALEPAGARWRCTVRADYASGSASCFEDLLLRFRAEYPGLPIRAAGFGVAGPRIGDQLHATNLAWPSLDGAGLGRALGGIPVALLNDLEAAAHGVLELGPEQRVALNPAARERPAQPIGVIAAGTGLGEALLLHTPAGPIAVAGEGGHADFAPRDAEEAELLVFARAELGGRVSVERILSGQGIERLQRFERSRSRAEPSPELALRLRGDDAAAAIADFGLRGTDPVCAAALERFAALLGAEAGNLALRGLTLGGLYLTGGIAPRLREVLARGAFLRAFTDKGRFAELLGAIPVWIALDPDVALHGAARRALSL